MQGFCYNRIVADNVGNSVNLKKKLLIAPFLVFFLLVVLATVFSPVRVDAQETKIHDYFSGTFSDCFYDSNYQYSQSFFTTATTTDVNKISLNLYRNGSSGTFYIGLKAVNASHQPTGSYLAEVSFTQDSLADTTWTEVIATTSVSVSTSTEYAIVVRAPSTAGNALCVRFSSPEDYADADYWFYSGDNGSSWNAQSNQNLNFGVWTGETTPEEPTPTSTPPVFSVPCDLSWSSTSDISFFYGCTETYYGTNTSPSITKYSYTYMPFIQFFYIVIIGAVCLVVLKMFIEHNKRNRF